MTSVFLATAVEHQLPGRLEFLDNLVETIEAEYGEAFYAARQWSDPSMYPPPIGAFDIILKGLNECRAFVLYYPDKVPSGALVELGLALSKCKPCFVYTEDLSNITYFLREGGAALTVSTNQDDIWPWIQKTLPKG